MEEANQPHEAGLLKLDISKAVNELRWSPVFTAGEAIERTINWYRHFEGRNAYDLIKQDILSFERIIGEKQSI